jgi:hypothetical protein
MISLNDLTEMDRTRRDGLQIGRDGRYGTGRDALLTDDTARSGEVEPKGFGIEAEGFRRANAGAEAAVDATVFIDEDFLAGQGDLNIEAPHPVHGGIEFVDIAGELHHHFADLVGSNLGADNAGGDVEVLGKAIGDRHLDGASGEGEGDAFFHGGSRE